MPDNQVPSVLSLSAIILAGGQSSRMGQDKALLPIQGMPMLKRVYAAAQACAASVYVVTPWPQRYPFLPPGKFIQEVPLPGEVKPAGPLVGFAQGLVQVQTDWTLLLACDLPGLKAEVLQAWSPQLLAVPNHVIALLPRQTKGWEPLCGFYRRSCSPALNRFIHQGGRSFQSWLAEHPVQELPLRDRQMLFNCNTPADLAEFEI